MPCLHLEILGISIPKEENKVETKTTWFLFEIHDFILSHAIGNVLKN
jgi:hypothetical protein